MTQRDWTGHEAEMAAMDEYTPEMLREMGYVLAGGRYWKRAELERYARMDHAELIATLTAEDLRPGVFGEPTPPATIEREADEIERALAELGYR